jgi:hypothetical protein
MAAELVLVTTSDEVRQSLTRFNSEAKQFRDRALSLLHQTTYWVYDDDSEQFGPAKFVGFDDMSFARSTKRQSIVATQALGSTASGRVAQSSPR